MAPIPAKSTKITDFWNIYGSAPPEPEKKRLKQSQYLLLKRNTLPPKYKK